MDIQPSPTGHQWIVWYADGSSYSNVDGAPETAPRTDVVCIVLYSREHGRFIQHRLDYYIWEDEFNSGQWLGVDSDGLNDYLDRPGGRKIRLKGRHIPPEIYWQVFNRADTDPRMPVRTSRDALEGALPVPPLQRVG